MDIAIKNNNRCMMRRWMRIGSGLAAGVATLAGLFTILVALFGFEITDLTGDIRCSGTYEAPCISRFLVKNPTGNIVDIYSKDQVKLDFSPSVKDYALFVPDGRCSATGKCRCELKDGSKIGFKGWRCIDFTNKTKPRKDKVYNFRFNRYSKTEFLLAGIKNNPNDIIKWGFGVQGDYLDPIWLSQNNLKKVCVRNTSMRTIQIDKITEVYEPKNDSYDNVTTYKYVYIIKCAEYHKFYNGIDMNELGFVCSEGNKIICDSKQDGNADGICQKGESCLEIDSKIEGVDYLGSKFKQRFIKKEISMGKT